MHAVIYDTGNLQETNNKRLTGNKNGISVHRPNILGLKETLICKCWCHQTPQTWRGMTWEGLGGQTNYSPAVLVFGILWVPAEREGKTAERNRQDGLSEWWRRRRRESAPGSACENQRPHGRPAELNYQENTVAKGSRKGYNIDLSHADSGKSVGGERGTGGKWEQRERKKKKMKLETEQARTNSEVKKCRRNGEKQIPLFEGRLYEWVWEFIVCTLILRVCLCDRETERGCVLRYKCTHAVWRCVEGKEANKTRWSCFLSDKKGEKFCF